MKKTFIISVALILILLIYIISIKQEKINVPTTPQLSATIISHEANSLTLIDNNDIIYTINLEEPILNYNLGDRIIIEYQGLLNKNSNLQNIEILNIQPVDTSTTIKLDEYQDNGIFNNYYIMAYNKLKELTIEEKIGQLILARYPEKNLLNNLSKYPISGYVFYEKDFQNKTKSQVIDMINEVQNHSSIPLLIAVDEEGGKVSRLSSNSKLVSNKFQSSQTLYLQGGLAAIEKDTINKSNILSNLGINLNLAPVVDVSTNPRDYIYERTIGQSTEITSLYAKTVISASKGLGVSYTLKHFPGYGNNSDTHIGNSVSEQSYETLLSNDIPPFIAGIQAGAEAILVSHNTVTSIDANNPASLSPKTHNFLRHKLNFTGVIITDDLHMGATKNIENAAALAIMAGNNLIITTDYINSINSIKKAIDNHLISEELINHLTFRVLAWKYYKHLIVDEK